MTRRSYSATAVPTTLQTTIGNTDASMVIVDVTGWPDGTAGPFIITVKRGQSGEEKILVGTRSGTTLSGLTRGYEGTTAVTHQGGEAVEHTLSKTDLDEANAHLNTTTQDDHPQYAKRSQGLFANRPAFGRAGARYYATNTDQEFLDDGTAWHQILTDTAGNAAYSAKGAAFLNVVDYGAVGDNSTDNLTAITNARAALGAQGGVIYFPAGIFRVSGTILANQDNVHFRGAGIGATTVRTTSATLPLFDFGDNTTLRTFLTVENMLIDSSVTRTAGAFIRARKTADLSVTRCRLAGAFYGIDLFDTQITKLTDLHIINCVASTGEAIRADSNTGTGTNLYLTRVATDAPVGSQPRAGLSLKQWDGVFLTDTQFNHSGTGLIIEPALGTAFTHLFAVNSSFDTNGNAGFVTQNGAGGAGTITRLWFSNCWFGSNTVNGMSLGGGASGVQFIAPKVFANGQHGVLLANCTDVHLSLIHISGNSSTSSGTYDGIFVAAGVSNIQISGPGRIGPFAGFANTQNRSVTIAGGAGDYITAQDFDAHGNIDVTNAFFSAATGTHNLYVNIKGYNPRGVLGPPAVPATGVAFTNPYSVACEVHVVGGTVTGISIGGTATGLTAGSIRVPAGQTITLNYSVAPTWTWFGD